MSDRLFFSESNGEDESTKMTGSNYIYRTYKGAFQLSMLVRSRMIKLRGRESRVKESRSQGSLSLRC
eukprot:scaffold33305_cov72-Skeletonema_dohrnii-CCMP3373.AAC.1